MAPNTSYAEVLDLDEQQRDLLVTALASNQPNRQSSSSQARRTTGVANTNAFQSPPKPRQTPGSSGLDDNLESPFIDYDADYDNEAGFEFDPNLSLDGEMIGSLPDDLSKDYDASGKRKSFDGEEEDDEGGGKRQETDEKNGKKPGRKPLTSEPTTKRKAQNRAAQRAFRERKEKHLKDLETKVTDLEKASESANHENTLLRSQVGRLTTELSEYRKRLASSVTGTSPGGSSYNRYSWHNSGNDFQFDFPTFGNDLRSREPKTNTKSGSTSSNTGLNGINGSSSASRSQSQRAGSRSSSASNQMMFNNASFTSSPSPVAAGQPAGDLFDPSIFASVNMSPGSDYISHENSVGSLSNNYRPGSMNRTQSNNVPQLNGGTNMISSSASPSASSVSQHGPGSSNETSPEPSGQSPAKTGETNLNTIEENGLLNFTNASNAFMTKSPSADINSIDWLAQQNGGQFAPDLYGDYRDTQDAVIADYGGSFFNEAFPLSDFGTPLTTQESIPSTQQQQQPPKKDLLQEMEKRGGSEEYLPAPAGPNMLNMNTVWDRLQQDEKYKNGDCDIETLCADMKKKARCTERGLAVKKEDVDAILAKDRSAKA